MYRGGSNVCIGEVVMCVWGPGIVWCVGGGEGCVSVLERCVGGGSRVCYSGRRRVFRGR